jgi:pyruvate/2-oxoglutarate dehydrogenase complex dihydrolipoamide acyltransferase (E2) component
MSVTIEIRVPDIGDFTGIPVIEVLVSAGDRVKAEDSLVTLESDKATMEVPSPQAGVIREMRLKLNDKVSAGDVVALLDRRQQGLLPRSPSSASVAIWGGPAWPGPCREPNPLQLRQHPRLLLRIYQHVLPSPLHRGMLQWIRPWFPTPVLQSGSLPANSART